MLQVPSSNLTFATANLTGLCHCAAASGVIQSEAERLLLEAAVRSSGYQGAVRGGEGETVSSPGLGVLMDRKFLVGVRVPLVEEVGGALLPPGPHIEGLPLGLQELREAIKVQKKWGKSRLVSFPIHHENDKKCSKICHHRGAGGRADQYSEWEFPFIFYPLYFGGFPLQVPPGLSPLLPILVDSCKERSETAENTYSFPLSEAGVETQE